MKEQTGHEGERSEAENLNGCKWSRHSRQVHLSEQEREEVTSVPDEQAGEEKKKRETRSGMTTPFQYHPNQEKIEQDSSKVAGQTKGYC